MQANTALDRRAILDEIVDVHGLDPAEIYLLPFVPLIEMIWADGRVQTAEFELLLDYARRWLRALKQDADGETVVSPELAKRFILRFLQQRPDPTLLRSLRTLAIELIHLNRDPARRDEQRRTLYEYCLDIAAAAVPRYPYAPRERVNATEKALLLEVFQALRLDEETPVRLD